MDFFKERRSPSSDIKKLHKEWSVGCFASDARTIGMEGR